jgi:hypothetical protein
MSDTRRDSGLGTRDAGTRPPIDLDAAIDAVACEMTAVEPSAALRARVLARLERERRRAAAGVPRWAWAGAAAITVLAVATGLWLTRPVPPGPGASESIAAERHADAPGLPGAVAPGPSALQGAAAASPAGVPAPSARNQRAHAARGAQPAAGTVREALAEDEALVPALAVIEPLRFSTVEPTALQIPGVEVAPLDAPPAIDIPSLDPGSTDTQSADPNKEK